MILLYIYTCDYIHVTLLYRVLTYIDIYIYIVYLFAIDIGAALRKGIYIIRFRISMGKIQYR